MNCPQTALSSGLQAGTQYLGRKEQVPVLELALLLLLLRLLRKLSLLAQLALRKETHIVEQRES